MIWRQEFWQSATGPSPARVALVWFWAVLVGFLAVGGVTLQMLGPPPERPHPVASIPEAAASSAAGAAVAPAPVEPRPGDLATPAVVAPAEPTDPRHAGAAPVPVLPHAPEPVAPARRRASSPAALPAAETSIAAVDDALQEPAPELDGAILPRIGPDGRMPAQAYAASFDAGDKRPRVAILLAGIGMAAVDSEEAIRATPAAMSIAMSPYAPRPARLLEVARATGHEIFVSIPMEPLGYPLNDAGNHSLLTGLTLVQNEQRLHWALSQVGGYVGATAAMSGLRGERFAASEQMVTVLEELGSRGLLYVDPRPVPMRPGGPGPARPGVRVADLVIDEPPVRSEIEARLSRLEQIARDRGSALGVAGLPGPVTVERLSSWAATLGSRGVALVPVSALVPLPSPFTGETPTKAHP